MNVTFKCAMGAAVAIMAVACSHNPEKQLTLSGLDPANFESTVDGKPTALYTLTNAEGMEACITNFGGRIVSLMVPDRDGKMVDVVLGHDSIADYVNIDGNFGALIGRYGNRINQGRITLNDSTYQLPQNNYGHCLHGGPKGFHNSVWDATQLNDSTLQLTLKSPDGEAGFPGNLDVKVTYQLTADNALQITYEADTDAPTICNLTNHAYFNLSGDPSQTILDEVVTIDAAQITPIDSTFMTSGEMTPVEGTPFDFRQPKAIGKDIDVADQQLANGHGFDHNFVLTPADSMRVVASAVAPSNGVRLEIVTDQPGLQFYVGNFLDGTVKGKRGVAYPFRGAFCMESQHYPDSPNKPQWPSTQLNPGDHYKTVTAYRFSTVK